MTFNRFAGLGTLHALRPLVFRSRTAWLRRFQGRERDVRDESASVCLGGAGRQCIEAVLPLATDEVRVDVRAPSRSAVFRYGQHVSAVERFDHATYRGSTDAEDVRRVGDRQQLVSVGAPIERRDAMVTAETQHPVLRPGVASTRAIAEAIEHAGDPGVGRGAREIAHHVDDRTIGAVAVVSCDVAWDDELGVLAALPMNDQLDLRLRGGRDLGDDLLNQEADDSLLGSDVRGSIGPHAREFFGELQEAGTIGWSLSLGLDLDRRQPLVQQPDPLEGALPTPLPRPRRPA